MFSLDSSRTNGVPTRGFDLSEGSDSVGMLLRQKLRSHGIRLDIAFSRLRSAIARRPGGSQLHVEWHLKNASKD